MEKISERKERRHSAHFKQTAVERMAAGVISVGALAADLKVRRGLLYRWRDQWKRLGEAAFTRKVGRPLGSVSAGPGRPPAAEGAEAAPLILVSVERRRIAELERQLGRKQLEVDFFQQAFAHVRGKAASNTTNGATESTPPCSPISRAKED